MHKPNQSIHELDRPAAEMDDAAASEPQPSAEAALCSPVQLLLQPTPKHKAPGVKMSQRYPTVPYKARPDSKPASKARPDSKPASKAMPNSKQASKATAGGVNNAASEHKWDGLRAPPKPPPCPDKPPEPWWPPAPPPPIRPPAKKEKKGREGSSNINTNCSTPSLPAGMDDALWGNRGGPMSCLRLLMHALHLCFLRF